MSRIEKDVCMIVFILLLCVLLECLLGCATQQSSAPPAPPVRRELILTGTIDGAKFEGVGIGSPATTHSMNVQSPVAVNYFTVQSCHRSVQFTDIIKVPWYAWHTDSKGFDWTYDEAPTIEDGGDCILRFCAFSKQVGAPPSACAIIDFHSNKYVLPGENICNGVHGPASGTAICHTQTGLKERFRFKGPVVIAPQQVDPIGKNAPYWISGQCVGKFIDKEQTLWEYTVPSDECVVIFMETDKPHRRAKLTVIPFNTPVYYGGN